MRGMRILVFDATRGRLLRTEIKPFSLVIRGDVNGQHVGQHVEQRVRVDEVTRIAEPET